MFPSAEREDIVFDQWFVTREAELQQAREAFAEGKSCLVTGPKGTGKTAFLKTTSIELHDSFPEGTIFLSGYDMTSIKAFLNDGEVALGSRILVCVDDIEICGPGTFSDIMAKFRQMPGTLVLAATSQLGVMLPKGFRKISLGSLDLQMVLERRLHGLRSFQQNEIAELISRATAVTNVLAVVHHGSVTPREALLAAYELLSQRTNVAVDKKAAEPKTRSMIGDLRQRTDPIGALLALVLFIYSTISGNEHDLADRTRHEELVQLINTLLVSQKPPVLHITTGAVHLREASNRRSHIVMTLPPTTLVEILGSNEQWFHVSASTTNGNVEGWVFNRYLRTIATSRRTDAVRPATQHQ